MDEYLKISSHCLVCGEKVGIYKLGQGSMKDIRSEDVVASENYFNTCTQNFCGSMVREKTEIIKCPENCAFIWSEESIV